jgi:long-subunit fatty acid transport protein
MRFRPWWSSLLLLALPYALGAQERPFGISLPPSLNFATSPAPVGSGARAAGKGFAFIAVADDATAASWNPGALIQIERPEAALMGAYFLRAEDPDVRQPETILDAQTLDALTLNYLSVAYPFVLFQRNMVVSVSVQRLFDLQGATGIVSRFTTIDGVQHVSSEQRGGLWAISPAAALQLTPRFSIGMAWNIWPDLFHNGWEQEVTVRGEGRVASGNQVVPFVSSGRIKEEFRFQGFNVSVGFLWTLNNVFSLGGVFRSPFTAKVTLQHASSLMVALQDGSAPVTSTLRFRDTLDMDMPLSYGLGLAARLTDALTLSLDVARVHWSDFSLEESTRDDVLLVENGAPSGKGRAVLRGQGDDTTSVRLGMEYLWSGRVVSLPVRAGFFYDPEPGEQGTDHFFGFSLGSGVTLKQFLFDVAYLFRTGTINSTVTDTAIAQHTFLASIIYHF